MGRTDEQLTHDFTYHAPDEVTRRLHDAIRAGFLAFAVSLNHGLPEGREKALALTKLEEAQAWAHAAIAREGA